MSNCDSPLCQADLQRRASVRYIMGVPVPFDRASQSLFEGGLRFPTQELSSSRQVRCSAEDADWLRQVEVDLLWREAALREDHPRRVDDLDMLCRADVHR